MPLHELAIWILIACIGLMGSALCSGLEVGLYAVSRVFVRVRSIDQPRAQLLHQQLEKPAPLLTTLLVYNNAFNYLATLAITALLSTTDLSETLIIVIQAIVLTPILLIFAESIPKELFRSRANQLMERLARVLAFMKLSLTLIPVTPIITSIANSLSKLIGSDLTGSVRSARHHMADLIKHADEQITQSQTEMIDRALQLNQTPIRINAVPLARVIRLSASASPSEALKQIKKSNHSRYPVHDSNGKIIGCIQTIDLYTTKDPTIGSLIKPIVRLNAEVPMRRAFTEMRAANAHLAIVTRSGQDAGILTRKDLLSPLIATTHDW